MCQPTPVEAEAKDTTKTCVSVFGFCVGLDIYSKDPLQR
jgi:hypothetical protein